MEKKDIKSLNIYEKIQKIKDELLKANLKKTGENKFAGFKYYELADFLPTIINLCNEYKVFTRVSFDYNDATLEVRNIEQPEEVVYYTSPMEELELKGCNKVQALGGTETYSRRYLYLACFDIIENDMFDKNSGEVTEEYANNYVFSFGKHNGEKLVDVIVDDDNYIQWLLKQEKTDEDLIKSIEILTGQKPKEIDLDLTQQVQNLLVESGTDLEKAIEKYNKDKKENFTLNDLTKEQVVDLIGRMKKKIEMRNKSE